MRKAIICLILLMIIFINGYSENNDVYSFVELIPDNDKSGMDLFYRLTGRTDEVLVLKSGWVNLSERFFINTFFLHYFDGDFDTETGRYNIMLLHENGILYHITWEPLMEGWKVSFFSRNNKIYMLIEYMAGAGSPVYFDYGIFEYITGFSFHNFSMIDSGSRDKESDGDFYRFFEWRRAQRMNTQR
ncbi:MAG: hypothetical protein FWD14_05925 [Treponema sp.]|nr:hypothetical protein [Treponema sp.]